MNGGPNLAYNVSLNVSCTSKAGVYKKPGRHIAWETKLSVGVPNTCAAQHETAVFRLPGEYSFEVTPMIVKLWIPGAMWQFKWRYGAEYNTTDLLWSQYVSAVGMAGNSHHDVSSKHYNGDLDSWTEHFEVSL
jgi:hypothetical protein